LEALTGRARSGAFAISIFPNLLMLAYPNGISWILRWTPISIDRTRARVWTYSQEEEDPERAAAFLEKIQLEDFACCEQVQIGMQSAFYQPGPRSRMEIRIRGFHRQLLKMLGEASESRTARNGHLV
jgi:carnitine monooxygenase subunit